MSFPGSWRRRSPISPGPPARPTSPRSRTRGQNLKNVSVAVDIGGTFTDLLAFDADTGQIHQAKCLSTPPHFATGVLDGVRKASLDLNNVESFVHGSTVAINTAIERTGALTALIVT